MKFDIKKIETGGGHLWYHLHENWCSESLRDMEDCPDCPEFNVKQASLLEKYNFMAFVMKYVRCTTKWGDLHGWKKREGREFATVKEDVGRESPVLCFQLVQIMALVAKNLNMNAVYVHFVSAEKSHWGIDVELEKNNWAFYDPTYSFCAKDPLPLDSKQIQDRPELLDTWQENFSHYGKWGENDLSGSVLSAGCYVGDIRDHFKRTLKRHKVESITFGNEVIGGELKSLKVDRGFLWEHLHENWCSESLQDMAGSRAATAGNPFAANTKQTSLLEKHDFMAFVMKYVRCTTKWGDLARWQEEKGRCSTIEEQVKRSSPVLCYQLTQIMALVAKELGMKSILVHFGSAEKSHWGIDVELEKNSWAFYDPTYSFCAKDPLPLDSKQIQDRPELVNKWHDNFSSEGDCSGALMTLPNRFKLPLRYVDWNECAVNGLERTE